MNKIHITTEMSGKMLGMASINTDPLSNPFCQKMHAHKKNICSACFAYRFSQLRPPLAKCFAKNAAMLSANLLDEELPVLSSFSAVRLHAYGELHNGIHFRNFCRIAAKNPSTIFTLWSKRTDIVRKNLAVVPSNMILIYSTPKINGKPVLPEGFHKVFTVFDAAYRAQINCARECAKCMVCYSHNDVVEVNELIRRN